MLLITGSNTRASRNDGSTVTEELLLNQQSLHQMFRSSGRERFKALKVIIGDERVMRPSVLRSQVRTGNLKQQ